MTGYEKYLASKASKELLYKELEEAEDAWIEAANAIHGSDYHIAELNHKVKEPRVLNDENKIKRKHLSVSVRLKVHLRDGGKCLYCGTTEDLTIDHIA